MIHIRKTLASVLFTLFCATVLAENKMTANDVTIKAGDHAVLTINIENDMDVAAFDFRLYLPSDITVAWDEGKEDYAWDWCDREPGGKKSSIFEMHMITTGDGSLLIGANSGITGKVLDGNNGSVITITLHANASAKNGIGQLKRIAFSNSDGTQSATPNDVTFNITMVSTAIVNDIADLSNSKQYIIRTKDEARGALGVANGELASTNPAAVGHKCEAASPFAILQYDGNYYLYSTADRKFITNTGGETDAPGQDGTHAVTVTKNTNGYFMFSFTSTGNVININDNPGIDINTWGQTEDKWDDGNQFTIDEAGDFDATEAIQMLVNYIVAVTDEQYQAALNSVGTDTQYAIYTLKGGTRYYLTSEGYLTAHPTRDCVLTFASTEGDGLFRSPGWKVDACFTNPHLSENGGESGALLPQGHILTDTGNHRDAWEGQVWYLGDNGCYAVRATNAVSDTWGANTYWTVLDTNGDGVPEADYSWAPAFVWQLESDVVSVGIHDIDNGQAHEADAWYTLDGRKLSGKPATKGIFIQNSKKVVVR